MFFYLIRSLRHGEKIFITYDAKTPKYKAFSLNKKPSPRRGAISPWRNSGESYEPHEVLFPQMLSFCEIGGLIELF